ARFSHPRTIEVAGVRRRAEHVLIATGARRFVPSIPGAEHGITSDGFFELETQPRTALVVGGGYVAVELAGVLNALGTEVTLLLHRETLLANYDTSVRETLMAEMQKNGVSVVT